jgi:hypothetical protein
MASQKDFQESVIANFTKLETSVAAVNIKIDTLNNQDITNLKLAMVRLETQVKIYAAIAGFIGMAVGGALVKFVVH